MNTRTTGATMKRADIDDQYKWNLTDLYSDLDAWENDFKKAGRLIENAHEFKGRLSEPPQVLFDCLSSRSKLYIILDNLHQYAKRSQDLDHRDSKFQMLTERAVNLVAQAQAEYAFLEPELLEISDERLLEMASQFPKPDVYDFFIKELIRTREHIRSGEVEEILAQSTMVARGAYNIFTMLNDADLEYPTIQDEYGNDVKLTKQRFAKFMESSDQRVRRDAFNGLNTVYKAHVNTLAASLATSVNKDVFYCRSRRYENCLQQALDAHNIPVAVYHSLIETIENDLAGLHKWMALRKKVMKLDKLYPYDVHCPLFPDQNYEIPYNEAVEEVKRAIAPLGDEYLRILTKAFSSRWVDVYETPGKASGAYSSSNYSTHPLVLMNYNNTVNNMFTLAHEMGHCMHSYLSNKTQPYPKAQYSVFVAEVASTLNEGLLLQHLLSKSDDPGKKLFLLNQHIDKTFGTFFHQVLYAHFELIIHELVEQGQALSPDVLNETWEKLTVKYYGPEVTLDEYSRYKWSRIPHFYYTYYVYQYATSYAASQAILEKFNSGEPGIVDRYLRLLSSGGNDYPINQLKKCGVDMTTPEPFNATLKLFAEQVDEAKRLTS